MTGRWDTQYLMKRRNANMYIFIFSNAILFKDYDKNEGTTVKNEGTIDKREAYTELCFEKSNLYIALMVIISIVTLASLFSIFFYFYMCIVCVRK